MKLIIAILFPVFLFAQQIESEENEEFYKDINNRFSLGIGYTYGFGFAKQDNINSLIKSSGFDNTEMLGKSINGHGWSVVVSVLRNMRIGFDASYGNSEKEITMGKIKKEVLFSESTSNLTIEYLLPFIRSMGISLGAGLGKGNTELGIYRNNNVVWGNLFEKSEDSLYLSRTLKSNYIPATVFMNIDYPFYRFLCLRLSGGYRFALGEKLTIDNNEKVLGYSNQINNNVYFIKLGILVGMFNF